MLTEQHRTYIDSTVQALGLEIAAARAGGSSPVVLEGGGRLAVDPSGATYRFALLYDSALPEGVPVQLEVKGQRWEAEVLQRDGLKVLLLVRRTEQGSLPEEKIGMALLRADPWYLVEMLQNAVRELPDSPQHSEPLSSLLDRLAVGSAPDAPSPPSTRIGALNAEQSEAVSSCTHHGLWFVWGPPGTGKTTTLGQVVAEAARRRESVLVAAHSNVAVDAALVAAAKCGVADLAPLVVRAGPAVLPQAKATGLSTREIALRRRPDLKKQLNEVTEKLASASGTLTAVVQRWRDLMAELRKVEDELLQRGSVIFATLAKMVASESLAARRFDMAIVDEVSMSYPAQVVVAAAHCRKRLAVFGDHKQLPPIVQSDAPLAKARLGRDVFTACSADRASSPGVTMLKEQFRMHPDIREVVSRFAYEGKLRDAPGVLAERAPIAAMPPKPEQAVVWYDVSRLGATRFSDAQRQSRFNPVSAIVSCMLAIDARRSVDQVVILTPYRAQARLLAALLNDLGVNGVNIGTIHRYQGSEAPVVVVDLVDTTGRSVGMPFRGSDGERLLTVGLSRAQGKLVVVGSRTMPTTGLSKRSLDALSRMRQLHHTAPVLPWSSGRPGVGDLTIHSGLSDDLASIASTDVVTAWLDGDLPGSLQHLRGPHAQRWESGHSAWLLRDGRFGLHVAGAGGGMTAVIASGPRLADALSDSITGGRLTIGRRANERDAAPPKATRHDECARCGGAAVPVDATRYAIEIGCSACSTTRRASDRELAAWLQQVGPRCPMCRSGLKPITGSRAPHGPFFGCVRYPTCRGNQPLEALLDAVVHPDPPPLGEAPSAVRKPRAAAASSLETRVCDACFLRKTSAQFAPGASSCADCA